MYSDEDMYMCIYREAKVKREAAIKDTTIDTVAGLVSTNVLSSLAQEKVTDFAFPSVATVFLIYLMCWTGPCGLHSVSAGAGGRSGGRTENGGGDGSGPQTERGSQLSDQTLIYLLPIYFAHIQMGKYLFVFLQNLNFISLKKYISYIHTYINYINAERCSLRNSIQIQWKMQFVDILFNK